MNSNSNFSILQHKTILLISPQPWGSLYISKNHYAIELAKSNNIVYYLCPQPKTDPGSNEVKIKPVDGIDNLFIIEHKLFFSFHIKFHFRKLFHFLMSIQTRRILKKINRKIDIVWSFDLGNYFPFSFFSKLPIKIFHPVDEPSNNEAIVSAENADVIFSVTNEILEKYKRFNVPKHFVNHGVSESFLNLAPLLAKSKRDKIHVGISGNLRRRDIDREITLTILKQQPNIFFDCWGEYQTHSNATDNENIEADDFIGALLALPNVKLHGMMNPEELAVAYQNADAFLICYDVIKDQSKGTNYHKVLEFISTGKVVISNNITTYYNNPHFVQMVKERDNNQKLPHLFNEIINHLSDYNSEELQQKRKAFASDNSYKKQLLLIDGMLNIQFEKSLKD